MNESAMHVCGGCGVERPQVSAEVVRPGAEVDKPATVISEALLASKQKRCGNKKGNLKNGGRHRGSTNVLVALNQMKKLPNIEKFRSFWKLHKMVAQERTAEAQDGAGKKVQKAAQKCFFLLSLELGCVRNSWLWTKCTVLWTKHETVMVDAANFARNVTSPFMRFARGNTTVQF